MIEGENNSLVVVVAFDDDHGWDDLLYVNPDTGIARVPGLNQDGVEKLSSALDTHIKAVAIEYEYIDKDYRDTFSGFHSKRFSTPSSRCARLHFFSETIQKEDLRTTKKAQNSYLGYTVIRPTRPYCIGRTLLNISIMGMPDAHVALCSEKVNIQGVDLLVRGFPFISQDGDATVCAQSSFWMVARYFSNRYSIYPETYPFQITELTKSCADGRRIYPSAGMDMWQIAEGFGQLGFYPLVYSRVSYTYDDGNGRRKEKERGKFDRLLYTYIESGLPLVIGVPDHVLAAYGHTFDSILLDRASRLVSNVSDATFSARFCDGLIVSDDNTQPYEYLPRKNNGSVNYDFKDIDSFVVPLPEKVFLGADDFEEVAKKLLRKGDYSIDNLSPTLAEKHLIFRMFLTTVKSYKAKIENRGMGHADVKSIYREIPLPHFIWVCEISTLDAYNNDNILGEIIWDATRNAHEPVGWIALHYPEMLIFDVGSALNGQQNIRTLNLKGSCEYPLYRSNLKEAQ